MFTIIKLPISLPSPDISMSLSFSRGKLGNSGEGESGVPTAAVEGKNFKLHPIDIFLGPCSIPWSDLINSSFVIQTVHNFINDMVPGILDFFTAKWMIPSEDKGSWCQYLCYIWGQ